MRGRSGLLCLGGSPSRCLALRGYWGGCGSRRSKRSPSRPPQSRSSSATVTTAAATQARNTTEILRDAKNRFRKMLILGAFMDWKIEKLAYPTRSGCYSTESRTYIARNLALLQAPASFHAYRFQLNDHPPQVFPPHRGALVLLSERPVRGRPRAGPVARRRGPLRDAHLAREL